MRDQDAKQMMQRCVEEIKTLRRINAELAPKAEAYESLRQVLNLLPQPSKGYGEDLVWKLERAIKDIAE
ncbi:hypothetical protein [uncultured Roseobacter sp.]|uniref:hypothetical protein n=1 Tax=uncultured Roseobacter sp. TaxID=114847 RepID=UPI002639BD72|nr:hypothetical protein [uncultured Roseobacter sp.]